METKNTDSAMKKPTIVIAEDDVIIREICLERILNGSFDIVASVGDGEAAVTSTERYKPEVVLLDVSLPVLRGFDAARRILALDPQIKVLFVSNYMESAYVEEAYRMGASGYVLKSRAPYELLNAIQAALAGQFYRPVLMSAAISTR